MTDKLNTVGEKLATLPSNAKVENAINKEIDTLNKFEADDATTYKGERICEDVKRILEDEKVIIKEKNAGQNIQKLFRDSYLLAFGLSNDDRFKGLFENWGTILASVSKSTDWTDITKAFGSLAIDLRETESFVRLLVELREIVKLLVSQAADKTTTGAEKAVDNVAGKVDKVVDTARDYDLVEKDTKHNVKDATAEASDKTSTGAEKARDFVHQTLGTSSGSQPISDEKYFQEKEKQRKKMMKNLNLTLKSLSENPTWKALIAKAESLGTTTSSATSVTADAIATTIQQNPQAQVVIGDLQAALQDIVGKDVDVKPFFDYTRLSIEFILHDPSYGTLARDARNLLTEILEHPDCVSKEEIKERLRTLSSQIEDKLDQINNNGYIQLARTESEKIMKVIKNDPASNKLLKDIETLLNHLRSSRAGEVVDPELLQQIRLRALPLILSHIADIPVPGFSSVEDTALGKFEISVQNLKIDTKSLVPENIHVKFKYNLDAHPMTLSYDNQRVVLILHARNIQVTVKDCEWSYKRLTTPHLNDSGLASLETDGNGLEIKIKMEVDNLAHTHINQSGAVVENKEAIKVLKSYVNIDKINIHFKESKHDKMYEVLFTGMIKRQIENMLVSKMQTFATAINHNLYVLYNEALISKGQASDWASSAKDSAIGGLTDKLLNLTPTGIIKDQLKDSAKDLFSSGIKSEMKESIKETISGESHKEEFKSETKSDSDQQVYHITVKSTESPSQ